MSTRTRKTLFTAEELLRLSRGRSRYELVQGELFEMAPAGAKHGRSAVRANMLLGTYVQANQLGETFAAETGFILARNPDTVRAPDACFVSAERLPPGELPASFLDIAPDLVVEVLSPEDTAGEVQQKVSEWLAAGTRLVWVIDPRRRSATVYRPLGDPQYLSENDVLGGEDVIPGFTCQVRDLVVSQT